MTKASALLQAWQRQPRRQQWLLGACAVGLVLAAGDAALTAPLEKRVKAARQQTAALQARVQAAQAAQLAAQPGAGAEPQALRAQEVALRQRLQAAQAALQQQLAGAARLPETLRAITATVGAARVLELNLAAAAEAPAAADATAATASGRRLYRLPITLKVSGSYDELQTLLAQIDTHAPALQWSALALDGTQWPAIELTLKAYVLSLDPRWGASS